MRAETRAAGTQCRSSPPLPLAWRVAGADRRGQPSTWLHPLGHPLWSLRSTLFCCSVDSHKERGPGPDRKGGMNNRAIPKTMFAISARCWADDHRDGGRLRQTLFFVAMDPPHQRLRLLAAVTLRLSA